VPLERRSRRRTALGAAVVLALAALVPAIALGSPSLTVRGALSAPLSETVAVSPSGRTLYALSGESSHHLLCKSSTCAALWPPLTVSSRHTRLKAGPGVHGTLALLRRPNGALQVTLRGRPLYRYAGDTGAAQGHGEGIRSFGGVWHAVTASASAPAPAPMSPAPESTPPYGY
jgi:predicted lipoprotein with Yx(FWY)xxD motif